MLIRKRINDLTKTILNKKFGVMTERQIQATTLRLGRQLKHIQKRANKTGIYSDYSLQRAYELAMPKHMVAPIVTTSKQKVIRSINNKNIDNNYFKEIAGLCAPSVLSSKKSLIYIKRKKKDLEHLASTGVHEFRHFLDSKHTIEGKIDSYKIILKSYINSFLKIKTSDRFKEIVDDLYLKSQKFCWDSCEDWWLKNPKVIHKEMQDFLRRIIKENNIQNPIKALKKLNSGIKDEIKAFSAAGRIERFVDKRNIYSYGEICAQCQELFSTVIELEIQQAKINRIKKYFCLK